MNPIADNSPMLAAPLVCAAIDAGSNAIRLLIAEALSAADVRKIEVERLPVRLGKNVFTQGAFDAETIEKAIDAFRHFAALFKRYGVTECRAVATSATREAKNRAELIDRILQETGIRLEVIVGAEEAVLVGHAVRAALAEEPRPLLIADLGGGSLDMTIQDQASAVRSLTLPIGTVRLMESLQAEGALKKKDAERVREHVKGLLASSLPIVPELSGGAAVLCGGNAEILAQIVPGAPRFGCRTLDLEGLEEELPRILESDVRERMSLYDVRKDRAEVMAIAAVVFSVMGRHLGVKSFVVPGVGVREGCLAGIIERHFAADRADLGEAIQVVAAARRFAHGLGADLAHAEKVRTLAVSIFDQLQPIHRLDPAARVVLEAGAILHDVGHVAGRFQHHRHGEYLVHSGVIPHLDDRRRESVACLVRFHGKTDPDNDHGIFERLPKAEKKVVRMLTGILRIADGLDAGRTQEIDSVKVTIEKARAVFRVRGKDRPLLALWGAKKKARLLEREIDLQINFHDGTRT